MIKRFLNDSLDMVLDGLARLGLVRGGAAWWRSRHRLQQAEAAADAENLRRSIRATHRMCRECRSLVPTGDAVCPSCGASMRGIPRGGVPRLLQSVLPAFGSASTALLGAIGIVYIASCAAGPAEGALLAPSSPMLYRLGAKYAPAILAGEWWRLVNPIFLHAGLLHIAMNAYALSNLGPLVEQEIGARRYLVVFMATGVFSFLVSAWWSAALGVGASGALYGLIGFGIVWGRIHGGTRWRAISDHLVQWAMFGLLLLFFSQVDNAAHAGGFVAGCALGVVVRGGPAKSAWVERLWTVAAVVCAALPLLGFFLAIRHGLR